MSKRISVDGVIHSFPDAATDDDINQALGGASASSLPEMPKMPVKLPQMKTMSTYGTEEGPLLQGESNPAGNIKKSLGIAAVSPLMAVTADPAVRRAAVRGVKSAGETIAGIPSAIYHAAVDPATPEEMRKSPEVYGNGLRRAARRLSGVDAIDTAEAAYRGKNSGAFGPIDSVPKVTPESALEVAPEAVGSGVGTALAGKLAEVAPKVVSNAISKTAPGRAALAQKLVDPMVYENVGETAADVRTGTNPARGVVDEGLVGTKKGLAGSPGKPGKIAARLSELKSRADNILQNHPNSRQIIDMEPVVDSAIDDAIQSSQKVAGGTERLEALRTALKTKYGKLQGTPYEMNKLKTDIQEGANRLGAFKNTQPDEATIAAAMRDASSRIKNAVNERVPEAADLNQRMSDLIDAKAGITRRVNQARGEDYFSGQMHGGIINKTLQRTVGSAPVRTGIARVLNAGNIKAVPPPAEYVPPQIAGLLKAAPIELGSEMEPIGAPSAPQSALPYQPSLQRPPAFVTLGEIKPAQGPQSLLFPNETPSDFRAGASPEQGGLFRGPVPGIIQQASAPSEVLPPQIKAGINAPTSVSAPPPEIQRALPGGWNPEGGNGGFNPAVAPSNKGPFPAPEYDPNVGLEPKQDIGTKVRAEKPAPRGDRRAASRSPQEQAVTDAWRQAQREFGSSREAPANATTEQIEARVAEILKGKK